MSNHHFSLVTSEPLKHFGICDASAAIPLGENHFIVGNDEPDEALGNILTVYPSQKSGQATQTIPINDFINTSKEIDLEAVTELNGVNYWITSHGRNKKGKIKPKRHQFFATKLTGDKQIIKQVGKSYQQLVFQDMINHPLLASLDLKKAETIMLRMALRDRT